jgi:hypothetical protein
MQNIILELNCPNHNCFERSKIKIIKRFNRPSDEIAPKYRTKRTHDIIPSCLIVGRDVREERVENYLTNYLKEIGYWKYIIRMNIL